MTETQPLPDSAADLHATEQWFVKHGLPYFVPEERAAVRAVLETRRTAVLLLLAVVVALAAGVVLALYTEDVAMAPAMLSVVGLGAAAYALTTLRARPIVTWAVSRTFRSLRLLVPLVTRALPLLLLFITFLFINAEVWEVSARLDGAVLWLSVMLFSVLAVGFLLVRLPEELEQTDHDTDEVGLVEACRGTPLETRARTLATETGVERIVLDVELRRYEKANLILVLAVAQAVQVLLLSVSVFFFFLLFGALIMDDQVQENWTGGEVHNLEWLSHVSVELIQVSVFLAAFSGLYFTVSAVSDETYRDQFFRSVKRELDRAVAVRTVYLRLRSQGPV
jgi:hypothetical protein